MARKFLYVIAFSIILFIAGRIALAFYPEQLTRLSFTPGGAYEAQPALKPNAYADPAMWYARPGMITPDPTRWLPEGLPAENHEPIDAAVFFIHPTSYLDKRHWNAPLDDTASRRIATIVVRAYGSVFGAAPDVWAPRYRQATFGAFVSDAPEAKQALDLAYTDVAEAFDLFVAAQPADRPIVLAGHSQGSLILKRLLAEKVAGKPLAQRIVAAYVVGWLVDMGRDLPRMGLPACAAAEQAGCVVSFLSYADGADTAMLRLSYERFAGIGAKDQPAYLCSNPLTGGIGGTAPASANPGAIIPDVTFEKARLAPALVGAACAPDGSLRIGSGPNMGPFVLPGGSYHVYDYALYWLPLRQDFARRVAAWHRTH